MLGRAPGNHEEPAMKTIPKICLALAAFSIALSVTAPAALAQMDRLKNTTPEERAGAQTEMMKSKLALTPEQTPKIAAINQKYAKEMDPVIKGSEGPLMKVRHMKQINTKKEAELKQVLSPDQFQKYLASKEEMREQFEEKMEKKH
jgi:hypothetical protein